MELRICEVDKRGGSLVAAAAGRLKGGRAKRKGPIPSGKRVGSREKKKT